MSDKEAARRRASSRWAIFRGFAVAGCEPNEMGIGPVFAVPKLLERTGKKVDDIDLWELNEAFAVQVIYCRDSSASPTTASTSTAAPSRWATPTACRGARLTGHALIEGKRRGAKLRGGDDVHRRRHGRRRDVRSRLTICR